MKLNIDDLERAMEQLERAVKEQIQKIGNNEAARRLGLNKAYISRFMTGKQVLSTKQLIEIYRKLSD